MGLPRIFQTDLAVPAEVCEYCLCFGSEGPGAETLAPERQFWCLNARQPDFRAGIQPDRIAINNRRHGRCFHGDRVLRRKLPGGGIRRA